LNNPNSKCHFCAGGGGNNDVEGTQKLLDESRVSKQVSAKKPTRDGNLIQRTKKIPFKIETLDYIN